MTTLLSIGQELRRERQRRRLFKTKLAQASGVHRNTLSELEAGAGNVTLNTLIAVCKQLGLDIRLISSDISDSVSPVVERRRSALSQLLERKLAGSREEPK